MTEVRIEDMRVIPILADLISAHVLLGCPNGTTRPPCASQFVHDVSQRIYGDLKPMVLYEERPEADR